MLRAVVKIAVVVHLEDLEEVPGNGDAPALDEATIAARFLRDGEHAKIKMPLQVHVAGEKNVTDKAAAERMLLALLNAMQTATKQLSIVALRGDHVPKLEAAFGGDQEPVVLQPGESRVISGINDSDSAQPITVIKS